nr:MAG TPA: hypothetical protein [Caudoviricetes sp.]
MKNSSSIYRKNKKARQTSKPNRAPIKKRKVALL